MYSSLLIRLKSVMGMKIKATGDSKLNDSPQQRRIATSENGSENVMLVQS